MLNQILYIQNQIKILKKKNLIVKIKKDRAKYNNNKLKSIKKVKINKKNQFIKEINNNINKIINPNNTFSEKK